MLKKIGLLVAILLSGWLLLPIKPAVAQTFTGQVEISAPEAEATISGKVAVVGTAQVDAPAQFRRGRVEYTTDPTTVDSWLLIRRFSNPRLASKLVDWDTTLIENGTYFLRVVIEDEVGNFIESEPVAVVVDNGPNAPLIPDPAEISAPIDGETVRRLVNIEGTASDRFITQSPFREEYQSFFDAGGGQPHFAYYKVEYSPGPEFTKWTLIDEIDIRDVVNDRLVQWETTGLTNGAYALRLRLVFKDGNYTDFQIVVTVDNPPIPQITAAEITEPADGAQLSRRLVVEGAAALHPAEHQFGRYLLEYGPGITPTVWTRLAEGSYSVQDVRLGATRIDDWPNGRYSLRLKVMDQDDVVVVQDQLTFTVDNPPPPTETVVDIATPADQAVIDERARIVGTAALAGDEYRFGRFYLEYGFGTDPTEWFEIRSSPFPEIDTRLGTWDTSEVDDGVYTIRLRVMDNDQTIELEDRVTITVAHQP